MICGLLLGASGAVGIAGLSIEPLLILTIIAFAEMGVDAEDLSLTIHPHPTLGETMGLAAEVFTKTITDAGG